MCKWYSPADYPESDGRFVDVWLHILGGETIRGLFIKNLDEPIAADAPMWFDEDQYLINPATVLFWRPRHQNDKNPDPPVRSVPSPTTD